MAPSIKGTKFVKRNRTRVGRADGTIICTLVLPALGERFDHRINCLNTDTKLTKLRKFLRKELGRADAVLEGGQVKIEACVRMPSRGLGRRRLATWRFGQSVEQCLSTAVAAWRQLPKEEDWNATEVVEASPSPIGGSRRPRKPAI